ncbi:unnamed protein product [Vicia faba]|uniref:H15 domain-containing protein n=1 Tax=Vicia faba TaxID=3906 RepID=A0AAV0ZYY3_VICFA|nr:unnamed protein product [Vicia faba]
MATEEPIVETVPQLTVPEPPASEKNEPKAQAMKTKKPKESKPKKASKPRSPSSHPTYSEMIKDAIVSLKEKNGSSQCAIAKFIEEKNKPLPSNFKKLLLQNLKKDVASGKLAKVKASFKLSLAAKKPVVAKPKTKPAAKAKKAVKAKTAAKPKAKAVVKPNVVSKAKPVTAKPKFAASKPKAGVKSKPNERPTKVAKMTLGKKGSVSKPALKKIAAVKSIKSPAKKVSMKIGGRK